MKKQIQMRKRNTPSDKNDFEKDMADLTDWQEHQYSPGYYVGTGRIPRPIKAVAKYPILFVVVGFFSVLLLVAGFLMSGFSFENFYGIILPLFFALLILSGGIMKMRNDKKK